MPSDDVPQSAEVNAEPMTRILPEEVKAQAKLAPLGHPVRLEAAAHWMQLAAECEQDGEAEAANYAREKARRIESGETPVFSDRVRRQVDDD